MADFKEHFDESSRIASSLADHTRKITEIVQTVETSLKAGGKLIVFGNGGSAAQAQHVAAELVVRFKKDRIALPAIALTSDTSILTATANDYGFEYIFSRQIEALAKPNDVVLALTTSGNSPNVLRAIETAARLKLKTIALLGKDGGKLREKTDIELIVDSQNTARIQEAHLLILHMVAETVENDLSQSRGFFGE